MNTKDSEGKAKDFRKDFDSRAKSHVVERHKCYTQKTHWLYYQWVHIIFRDFYLFI